jgi:hypothetical protein
VLIREAFVRATSQRPLTTRKLPSVLERVRVPRLVMISPLVAAPENGAARASSRRLRC